MATVLCRQPQALLCWVSPTCLPLADRPSSGRVNLTTRRRSCHLSHLAARPAAENARASSASMLMKRNSRAARTRVTTRAQKSDVEGPGDSSTSATPVDNEGSGQEGPSGADMTDADVARPGGFRGLALGTAAASVGLFLATRMAGAGPDLNSLAAIAVPYDQALANGRPTVVEFYADWCQVCRETLKDVFSVEQQYKDKVNFVMINIDNAKWREELDEFGVEGIPHFAFLDARGNEEGNVVGRLPRRMMEELVQSLARGDAAVPYSGVLGEFSLQGSSQKAPALVGPRSHGV
eukprot:jgi/Mesen1/5399/ME000268S04595